MDFFRAQMASLNHKQVPFCTNHYKALHNNNLLFKERQLFKDRSVWLE
jgi:hypothetical protein